MRPGDSVFTLILEEQRWIKTASSQPVRSVCCSDLHTQQQVWEVPQPRVLTSTGCSQTPSTLPVTSSRCCLDWLSTDLSEVPFPILHHSDLLACDHLYFLLILLSSDLFLTDF